MKRLIDDQREELIEAARGVTRPGMHTQLLASLGLVITGHGRFGGWVKATDAGQQYLARMAGRGGRATSKQVPAPVETRPDFSAPVATTGPAEAGILLRGAAPRTRRTAAKDARSTVANTPPAAAQNVGVAGGSRQATRGRSIGPARESAKAKPVAGPGTSSMPLQRKPRAPRTGRVADVSMRASGEAPKTKRAKRNAS